MFVQNPVNTLCLFIPNCLYYIFRLFCLGDIVVNINCLLIDTNRTWYHYIVTNTELTVHSAATGLDSACLRKTCLFKIRALTIIVMTSYTVQNVGLYKFIIFRIQLYLDLAYIPSSTGVSSVYCFRQGYVRIVRVFTVCIFCHIRYLFLY